MKFAIAITAISAAALLSACETTEPYAGAATADASAASGEDGEVCRNEEVTGTRFHRRVCMTAEEAERQRAETADTMNRIDRSRGVEPYGSGS